MGSGSSDSEQGRRSRPGEAGPSPEYVLAHYALRFLGLSDPLRFLAVIASPEANRFIGAVMQDVAEKYGRGAAFSSDAVRCHTVRVKDYPCAIFEFPEPREITGAHLTALVALIGTSDEQPPERADIRARYFTLEKGVTLDNEPRTVLAEWEGDTHSNYGDGPAPSVPAFAEAIARHL